MSNCGRSLRQNFKLELPTKRLSAARSEHRATGRLVGFRAIGREVGALFLRVVLLCRKKIHVPAWRP